MKHLIFTLLMGLSLISNAQNGGQYSENGSVKLEYVGGGKVRLYNKQACDAVIRLNDSQTETQLPVSANSSTLYTLPPGTTMLVKAKTTTNCGGTDFGWVELNVVTPLKFISKSVKYLSETDELLITLVISDAYNVNRIELEISVDEGHTYRSMGIVFPQFIIPNKPISCKIKCSDIRNYFKSQQ